MKPSSESAVAAKAALTVVAITFVAEAAIMEALAYFGYTQISLATALLDAAALSLVIAPPLYWLVLRPLRREFERRLEAEVMAQDMGRLAITDALTRIMNRRGITVSLLDAMAQSERYSAPLTVVMADIDHFKLVNDEYGHKAGDKVLAAAAGIFADALRMPDKVGRYGGEEFLMVLPHTTLAHGRKIAERIRAAAAAHKFDIGQKNVRLTVSLGLAQFRKGEDLEQLISRVDKALYEAKAGGRNLVATGKKR